MEKLKYMQVDSKSLSVLKWLFAGASHDDSLDVLGSLHIKPDGQIETVNGFQLHWVYDPELARSILDAVGVEADGAMVKAVKVQRVTSFEPEPVEGSFPDTMRIIPPAAKATFVIDAKKLADAVSGFDFIASFAINKDAMTIEITGKTKAGYGAYALLHMEEPDQDLPTWSPHNIPQV